MSSRNYSEGKIPSRSGGTRWKFHRDKLQIDPIPWQASQEIAQKPWFELYKLEMHASRKLYSHFSSHCQCVTVKQLPNSLVHQTLCQVVFARDKTLMPSCQQVWIMVIAALPSALNWLPITRCVQHLILSFCASLSPRPDSPGRLALRREACQPSLGPRRSEGTWAVWPLRSSEPPTPRGCVACLRQHP